MPLTDEELMRQVQNGDVAALGEIFDRYQTRLVRFLIRFGHDSAAAEDLAQDALWRLWEQRARFDVHHAALRTWLFVLARNVALNDRRRTARTRPMPTANTDTEDWGTVPAPSAEAITLRDTVRAALGGLPQDQRLCLILHEYEEMSYREIGEILACSEGAARVLAHRARQALRTQLRGVMVEEEREMNETRKDSCHAHG